MSRRHTEDSVIVSIDSVREMLKTETKPPDTQPSIRIAQSVAPEIATGVPSIAEVRARRLARWNDDGVSSGKTPVPLRPVVSRRRWQKAFLGLSLFIFGGTLAGVISLALAPIIPAPFSTAVDTVERTIGSSVLQARLSVTRSDGEKARTEAQRLSLTIDQLQSELNSLKQSESTYKKEATTKKASNPVSAKRKRTSKRKRPKQRRRATKKKRRKLDSNDKRLDSLINGL